MRINQEAKLDTISQRDIEIAIAWVKDELKTGTLADIYQVDTGGNLYSLIAFAIKKGYYDGRVKLNGHSKKPKEKIEKLDGKKKRPKGLIYKKPCLQCGKLIATTQRTNHTLFTHKTENPVPVQNQ